jgi:hypothetical protein
LAVTTAFLAVLEAAGNAWETSRHHLIRADDINIAPIGR